MNFIQIRLIRSSWQQVGEEPLYAGILFYDRLFTLAPHARNVFRSPVSEQTIKLMKTVGNMVKKLEKLDEVVEDISVLAQEYAHYGLTAMDYSAVAQSLLWTLEKRLADQWNNRLKRAWLSLYRTLCEKVEKMAVAA